MNPTAQGPMLGKSPMQADDHDGDFGRLFALVAPANSPAETSARLMRS